MGGRKSCRQKRTRKNLREAGEQRWSILALPFIVMGSTLFVVLTGMEIALMVADVQAVQSALFSWFIPILLRGALSFALGSSASRWGSSAAGF